MENDEIPRNEVLNNNSAIATAKTKNQQSIPAAAPIQLPQAAPKSTDKGTKTDRLPLTRDVSSGESAMLGCGNDESGSKESDAKRIDEEAHIHEKKGACEASSSRPPTNDASSPHPLCLDNQAQIVSPSPRSPGHVQNGTSLQTTEDGRIEINFSSSSSSSAKRGIWTTQNLSQKASNEDAILSPDHHSQPSKLSEIAAERIVTQPSPGCDGEGVARNNSSVATKKSCEEQEISRQKIYDSPISSTTPATDLASIVYNILASKCHDSQVGMSIQKLTQIAGKPTEEVRATVRKLMEKDVICTTAKVDHFKVLVLHDRTNGISSAAGNSASSNHMYNRKTDSRKHFPTSEAAVSYASTSDGLKFSTPEIVGSKRLSKSVYFTPKPKSEPQNPPEVSSPYSVKVEIASIRR